MLAIPLKDSKHQHAGIPPPGLSALQRLLLEDMSVVVAFLAAGLAGLLWDHWLSPLRLTGIH